MTMKKIFLSTFVAGALLGGVQAAEVNAKDTATKRPVSHKTQGGTEYFSKNSKAVAPYVSAELDKHHKAAVKAPKELLMAFGRTYKALKLIQMNQVDAAIKELEAADKAFDAALKKHPELKMVPLSEQIFVTELQATPEQIKAAVDYSRGLLKAYHTQAAAALLGALHDEMDIETVYLPMELYPKAVKKALALLKKKDLKGALDAMAAGFDTLVGVKVAVPLPLLAAQDLVVTASKMDKNKKAEIEKLLKAAKEELQKAYYLGYTDLHPKAYNDLMRQIKAIEKEMGGKNMVEKLYEKLKKSFAELIGKTYHDSVARKEAQVLKNPNAVKDSAAAKAKVEEAQAKELFESKMEAIDFENAAIKDAEKKMEEKKK